MEILENHGYHQCLLLYKGLRSPEEVLDAAEDEIDFASRGYGVGNWFLVSGDTERAHVLFRRILDGENWMAFGYFAAEAEIARLRN